ncbi:N-acetyltransferase family protein [Myroides ceti]|uniref:N-acetyltransferase family protein n=1 Tax=Paenimyroides ceti TaxID=395087 RepID=A0ABT8CPS7_9FLAO|nr:GNAT family N-acetyltransferase [Paenimyroides ceti]MDN3705653.1 N-acetyltransferase family protein [Paenimyroides ceti]
MEKLYYRNAQLEDLEQIVAIYNTTIASRMVTADTEPVKKADRMQWFEQHTHGIRPLIVVENTENVMVGWISFQSFYGRPAYNHTAEISIYLDETQRGKGLGKRVLQYAIDHATKYEITTLLGFIFSHNLPSLRLFYSLGFEDWGLLPNVAVLDGIERSLTIVGRKIV